jgi:uncharacterized membrane protein YfhO
MIGIAVILLAFVFTTNYTGKSDKELQNNLTQQLSGNNPANFSKAESTSVALMEALRADRKSQATNDLMRSLLLICIAGVIIYFSQKKKIPFYLSIAGLITLITYDLLSIDKRYLNEDKFTEATEETAEFLPSPADQLILNDPDHANFRVFNASSNFTNESNTSYFHNSIGGYHPAKLGLYQDLIEHQLSKRNSQVLNMLNTKYVLVNGDNGQPQALRNDEAYGNCWLVRNIKYVQTPNEEMLALDSTNLKEYAIINQSFKSQTGENPVYDSTASIKVLSRDNDHIAYASNAQQPQLAVFSEIYYNRGWNAYLDGKRTDHIKANYLLRAMKIPAGQHKIEFKFEPIAYYSGVAIAKWSILFLYLMLIASMLMPLLKKVAKQTE